MRREASEANPLLASFEVVSMLRLTVDRANPVPLYYQIYQQIRGAILNGQLDSEQPLPTEPALAADLGVSRFTIRQAVDLLVREGLVWRKRGRGTFISDGRADLTAAAFHLIPTEAGPLGAVAKIGRFERDTPPPAVAAYLGLPGGERVTRFSRIVRCAAGAPGGLFEWVYVPERIAPRLLQTDVETFGLYTVLAERFGYRPTAADELASVVDLTEEAASQLGVRANSPGLRVERVTRSGEAIIEFRQSFLPAATFQLRGRRSGEDLMAEGAARF